MGLNTYQIVVKELKSYIFIGFFPSKDGMNSRWEVSAYTKYYIHYVT